MLPTSELFSILAATLLISSGSLLGLFTISLNQQLLSRLLLPLVSLSAGTMLGAALLHLLPESLELLAEEHLPFQLALASFVGFFVLERFLQWRHCHDEQHLTTHTLGVMNLLGDALHNFLDGVLIAAAFLTSFELGLVTTFAIALHEIPQELGDFGVLLHSGFTRLRALWLNLSVGLASVAGGLFAYFAAQSAASLSAYLIPIAAGGFLYIAAADLVPEMKKPLRTKPTFISLAVFLLGLALMFFLGESH